MSQLQHRFNIAECNRFVGGGFYDAEDNSRPHRHLPSLLLTPTPSLSRLVHTVNT